ncbi:type II toxin-antitoxin system HicB family antitoxin [Methanothrix sp.]|uniref:type II toxin-antitoxin system HicB family antitoxin n=1 Tax=Methanothrix sp. TaxID=90426 RepID=UPI0032980360
MSTEYIHAAVERAVYITLEREEEPFFVSVPESPGAWSTGKTVEEVREKSYWSYRRVDTSWCPAGAFNLEKSYEKMGFPLRSGCRPLNSGL